MKYIAVTSLVKSRQEKIDGKTDSHEENWLSSSARVQVINNRDRVHLRSLICQLGEGRRQVLDRSEKNTDSIITMNHFSA